MKKFAIKFIALVLCLNLSPAWAQYPATIQAITIPKHDQPKGVIEATGENSDGSLPFMAELNFPAGSPGSGRAVAWVNVEQDEIVVVAAAVEMEGSCPVVADIRYGPPGGGGPVIFDLGTFPDCTNPLVRFLTAADLQPSKEVPTFEAAIEAMRSGSTTHASVRPQGGRGLAGQLLNEEQRMFRYRGCLRNCFARHGWTPPSERALHCVVGTIVTCAAGALGGGPACLIGGLGYFALCAWDIDPGQVHACAQECRDLQP